MHWTRQRKITSILHCYWRRKPFWFKNWKPGFCHCYNKWLPITSVTKWVECSPMVREIWVLFPVGSYQRVLKWYLIHPCLTLSGTWYVLRVKWRNPGKGVAPSPTPRCSSYWKGSFRVALDYGRQLYFLLYSVTKDVFYCQKTHKNTMT